MGHARWRVQRLYKANGFLRKWPQSPENWPIESYLSLSARSRLESQHPKRYYRISISVFDVQCQVRFIEHTPHRAQPSPYSIYVEYVSELYHSLSWVILREHRLLQQTIPKRERSGMVL